MIKSSHFSHWHNHLFREQRVVFEEQIDKAGTCSYQELAESRKADLQSELPESVHQAQAMTRKAELVSENQEKMENISHAEFLKLPQSIRLALVTKGHVASESLDNNDQVTFDFHDNYNLYQNTTAGQVLPATVTRVSAVVKSQVVTFTRLGLTGEFFSESNQRLIIHSKPPAKETTTITISCHPNS